MPPVDREDSDLAILRQAIILAVGRARSRTDRSGLIAFLEGVRADVEELIEALKAEGKKS